MSKVNKNYSPASVEEKWQDLWVKEKIYQPNIKSPTQKHYNLWMFPYPSAEGLHAGHAFASTGSDIYGRFVRMNGYDVFQPIGYDSFGIHSENYAIKIKETPQKMLSRTTRHYEEQLKNLGHAYDWSHTVTTSDVNYYIWTQWLFVQMFKKGLAYKAKAAVNFCPSCKTVLADEQAMTPSQAGKEPKDAKGNVVEAGDDTRVCERCGTVVEKRDLDQWFFRITDYADRLLEGLEKIDWSERVKIAQKEWIGKSKGLTINFSVEGKKTPIPVWTKFWETVFGATFLVIAPEYFKNKLSKLVSPERAEEVSEYIKIAINKTEQQRKEEEKEKTGVFSGVYAVNPVNGRKVPIWVADYILMDVGTGAVMGVPAHDTRDFDFAKKYDLEIIQVVSYKDSKTDKKVRKGEMAFEGEGKMVNSNQFNGLDAWTDGKKKMAKWMIQEGFASWETSYHLRDWLVSRQRYWGAPIPMIYCKTCASRGKIATGLPKSISEGMEGWFPVPEEDLPVTLPEIKNYEPEGSGKGPLANHPEFYKVKCPVCGGEATRETDVMDTFVDSSWYFLRYPSVGDDKHAFNDLVTKTWLPVDLYFGGAEHSVLHLMYSRFVTMALYDMGYLKFDEPFPKFFAHGLMIKDGAKMSKSRGNVVNPDEYVKKYGADTLRLYLMFMGPMDGYPDFRDAGIEGMQRFLNRVWRLSNNLLDLGSQKLAKESVVKLHQTIKKVTEDIQEFKYNTAIASIMELVNVLEEDVAKKTRSDIGKGKAKEILKSFALILAPFTPHIAEEIWDKLGEKFSIHKAKWPKFDEKLIQEDMVTIPVQVNGKLRGQVTVRKEESVNEKLVIDLTKEDQKISKWIKGGKIKKTIFVKGKLVNFVCGK